MKLQATRERKQRNFAEFLQQAAGVTPQVALLHRVAVVHADRIPRRDRRNQPRTRLHQAGAGASASAREAVGAEYRVTLKAPARGMLVFPLGAAGERLAPLPDGHVRAVPGGFEIHVQADGQEFSPWYELTAVE